MRLRWIALALLAFVTHVDAASASRRGVAQSVAVAAQREAGSRRPYRDWRGDNSRYVKKGRADVRRKLAASATPGSEHYLFGLDTASRHIALVAGRATGRAPTDVRAASRRHDRALRKIHRKAIHRIEQARAAGVAVWRAFPGTPMGSTYDSLLAAERAAISAIERGERWK